MLNPSSTGDINTDQIIAQYVASNINVDRRTVINVIQAGVADLSALLTNGKPLTWRQTGAEAFHLSAGERQFVLTGDLTAALRKLAADPAVDDNALRRQAYAAWLVTRHASGPPQHVAARDKYIPLSGQVGREQPRIETGFTGWYPQPDGPAQSRKLADVTEALAEHPAFVLLGAPGSGKSTVLHRLEQDMARRYLTGQGKCLPLLLALNGYLWRQEDPLTFVNRQWEFNTGVPLVEMLRGGRVALLLDGLNEMDRLGSHEERRQRANHWQGFLELHFSDLSLGNRAIVAGRTNDYEQSLNLPRVEIDPLNETQILAFLQAYLGDGEAENAFAAIKRLDLLELAKVPFSLAVLADQYDPAAGDLPPNQGRLFQCYVDGLLKREDERAKKLYCVAARLALNQLGYRMQERGESTALPADDIEALIPAQVRLPNRRQPEDTPPPVVFDVACGADLLRPDPTAGRADMYKFTHQLLQEQLAAADLYQRWQQNEDLSRLWRVDPGRETMPPAEVGEWDALPGPPATGWEQTTLQTAGLPDYADTFVRAVLAENPALAGRCITEGMAQVSDDTRQQVQMALLAALGNPAWHRRARLQAGRVLAALGDPRFAAQEINGAMMILPELVAVPGGKATIGRDKGDAEAYDDEHPAHSVEIAPFYLGRYPVTNAEYSCFIKAGGYDNPEYWMPAGWAWRKGEGDVNGPVDEWLGNRTIVKRNPVILEQLVREGRMAPDEADNWRRYISWTDEEARRRAEEMWPQEAHTQPYYWEDAKYNGANQPVVGVTWYEAMAYCGWLAEQLRMMNYELRVWQNGELETLNLEPETYAVRLPTEAEWEWAAGGAAHKNYPWGDAFDPDKANTLDGRVMGTSAVGAYPVGIAGCGALDMAGNVYEWTRTLSRAYPYRADDGREDALGEGRRVVRGGSWLNFQRFARVSYRYDHLPDDFYYNIGFRLIVSPNL